MVPYIVLHKSEWERIQRRDGPPPEEFATFDRERKKELMSQKWIKSWPDTLAGHLALLEKQRKQQKKKQHQADIEFMKAYTKRTKKASTTEAVKQAKQIIFQNSSYGRQLISALLESKALEEREAQIKFNKTNKEKAAKIEKEEQETLNGGIYNFHDNDEERGKKEKLKKLEIDTVNKYFVELKKENEIREKLEEDKSLTEEIFFIKQMMEIVKKQMEDIKRCEKQRLEIFQADSKQNANLKAHDQKIVDAITDVYKREQDRIWLKSRAVMEKIHQGRPDSQWSKNLYEKVKQIQNEESKRYKDFIDKGIEAYEKRISENEFQDKINEKEKKSSEYLCAEMHKIAVNEQILAKKCENKCVCERQTLAFNSKRHPIKKIDSKANNESLNDDSYELKNKASKSCGKKTVMLTFLAPRNTLTNELRKREKEASPYNCTKAAHAHFAEQADEILKEIKHKHFARKVVDDYRRLNLLDDTSLPVPNY